MAVFPPFFPNLVEVRVEQTLPGNVDAVNVMFFERAGVADFSLEAEDISNALTAFWASFAVSLSDQWSLDLIRLIDRSVESGQEELDASGAMSGGSAAHAVPTQNTICMTLRTAQSGRRYRGRVNLSGWTEASNDADGDFNADAANTVRTSGTDLLADLALVDASLVVLSRGNTSPPAPEAWAAFTTPVTTVAVNREWDVLRSRRR